MRITENLTGYTEEELFGIADRENNSKRAGLIVNRLQAKHIPAVPSKTLELFYKLAAQIERKGKKSLIIGFAETATAIGAAVAEYMGGDCTYIHTSRENIPEKYRIADFSEEHSHATEQNLFALEGRDIFKGVDRVVFVEDELTTGKTILNFIDALKGITEEGCSFGAASLINGMSEENLRRYSEKGIDLYWLVKLDDSLRELSIKTGKTPVSDEENISAEPKVLIRRTVGGKTDPRTAVFWGEYVNACQELCVDVFEIIKDSLEGCRVIDVIGTEECMYPSIRLGRYLEAMGYEVRCHSTTRSPIVPCADEGYPLDSRCRLESFYDRNRNTYIYNMYPCDMTILLTDSHDELMCTVPMKSPVQVYIRWAEHPEVNSSYKSSDVSLLLKDITGMVKPLPASEREPLIQSGVHYCEMLPLEKKPSEAYLSLYNTALDNYSEQTAGAAAVLAEKIYKKTGGRPVLVSLARAGIPAGILVKHYLERRYGGFVRHYSISIIRGRGIDRNALDLILRYNNGESIVFVDGWTGKGAIQRTLREELNDYPQVDHTLAVLADPAYITDMCGTHEDFLIASSCLNSTVSGLISRTFLRSDIIGEDDLHGCACYSELADEDRSYEFIRRVERCFDFDMEYDMTDSCEACGEGKGIAETRSVAEHFGIEDINLVKPGIGETTRVLLRRVPYKVLVRDKNDTKYIGHILRLAEENNVPVEEYPLKCYRACGIIKNMADT